MPYQESFSWHKNKPRPNKDKHPVAGYCEWRAQKGKAAADESHDKKIDKGISKPGIN